MKSRLFVAVGWLTALVPLAGHTATLSIGQMNITGGTFGIDPVGPFPFATIGPNTNLVGGYIGNGGAGSAATAPDPDSIVGTQFSSFWLNVYTASTNLGDDVTAAATLTGGPVPTGSLDTVAGTITMDLSSWFGNWNNIDFHAGTGKNDGITSAFATGTWNPVTGEYALSWQSAVGGPFVGNTSFWTLQGVASPVPMPPALWLFGSGLAILLAVPRRR